MISYRLGTNKVGQLNAVPKSVFHLADGRSLGGNDQLSSLQDGFDQPTWKKVLACATQLSTAVRSGRISWLVVRDAAGGG